MKWKPKNDTVGVPNKGFIKAEDFSQEDEDALLARAKRRKVNPVLFMTKAGFELADTQLDMYDDDEGQEEEKPKKVKRAKQK